MPQVLILGQREVRELLPMAICIELVAEALATLARGEGVNPLRAAMVLPDRSGLLGTMPAALDAPRALGIKVIAVYPGNHGTEFDAHQGAVLLFERDHGRLVAVLDASELTAIRTAAASGVATRLLARDDATSVAILGSGIQAVTHLEAMLAVRPVERVTVWSRTRANAERYAEAQGARHEVEIEVAEGVADAVAGADIVCTTTSASEPFLRGEWLAAGTHVNAAGACTPKTRELDSEAVVRSALFTDLRESLVHEAGEFLIPQSEGRIDESAIRGELGGLLLGKIEGRRSTEEITLFKSLGIGVEDVGPAWHVYERATELGRGVAVPFSGAPPGQ